MFAWRAFPALAGEHGEWSPGAYLTMPALQSAGIRVAWTTRLGGRSGAPFASLNLSFVSGDDPDTVLANRARALGAVGGTLSGWTSGRQVHGAGVARVTESERGRGATSPDSTIAGTDALWTDEPGVSLVVLTADCSPIALVDARARRIAAVHAGWRGLVGGVIEAALDRFDEPRRVQALIGPTIGPCCYEVGEDVAAPAREAFGPHVVRAGAGKAHLDLWGAARIALARAGVREIEHAVLCTRCEPHRFYSHRAGDAGRQGMIVRMEP